MTDAENLVGAAPATVEESELGLDIVQAAGAVIGVVAVKAETAFEPPWTAERMNNHARLLLGAHGELP